MFVHERVPALRELENAVELRRNALFCENVDSFDNDCMLRGVPHTLGLDASIKQSKRGIVHALGWSGDGSANDGSLREFAVGAVVQHFPKTLNRVVDVDFKMPTAEQLDALLAFQRSLGRSADVDLASLRFADDEANKGIRVFLNGGRPGGCHACHGNAGAIDNIGNNFNGNFATGTIKLRPDLPHDGGFGTDPGNGHGLGDQGFNVPSLIEAADTAPFFHNNGARTLEQAIAFYATEHFETSPSGLFGGKFVFEKGQERQIATLLRYLNVDDNINAAKAVLNEAAALGKKDKLRKELVLQARSDIADGIQVLSQIKGGDKAVIKRATGHLKKARAFANNKFAQSIAALDAARATILAED